MTDPGFMLGDHRSVTSTGALRPGISAVVMTMSVRLSASAIMLALPALVILAHLPGIAAGGLGRLELLVLDGDESGAEALDLLLGGGRTSVA